jgi:hypothetical protein
MAIGWNIKQNSCNISIHSKNDLEKKKQTWIQNPKYINIFKKLNMMDSYILFIQQNN